MLFFNVELSNSQKITIFFLKFLFETHEKKVFQTPLKISVPPKKESYFTPVIIVIIHTP